MHAISATAIERACTRVIYRYALFADTGRYALAASQFTEDARLEMPTGIFEGLPAIQKRLENLPPGTVSRHVISNVLVTVVDSERAEATSYLTLYRAQGTENGPALLTEPLMIGTYTDRLVLSGKVWKFKARTLSASFQREPG